MATYIFPSKVGVPVVVTDPNATPVTFVSSLEGWGGVAATNCIVAGIAASTQSNVQFMLTLRNYTYVYVFGEKMGDIVISGLTLPSSCNAGNGNDGMTNAIQYYNQKTVSVTGKSLGIVMGGWSTFAFLIAARFNYNSPDTRVGRFEFIFKTVTDPA